MIFLFTIRTSWNFKLAVLDIIVSAGGGGNVT